MKENRQLNINELNDVNGGYAGSNKHTAAEYHEAGLMTSWRIWSKDEFYFCMPGNVPRRKMHEDEANGYYDYFKNHTAEEYIAHVQEVVPDYTQIIKGISI